MTMEIIQITSLQLLLHQQLMVKIITKMNLEIIEQTGKTIEMIKLRKLMTRSDHLRIEGANLHFPLQ